MKTRAECIEMRIRDTTLYGSRWSFHFGTYFYSTQRGRICLFKSSNRIHGKMGVRIVYERPKRKYTELQIRKGSPWTVIKDHERMRIFSRTAHESPLVPISLLLAVVAELFYSGNLNVRTNTRPAREQRE